MVDALMLPIVGPFRARGVTRRQHPAILLMTLAKFIVIISQAPCSLNLKARPEI
jgi:hypothetical protein